MVEFFIALCFWLVGLQYFLVFLLLFAGEYDTKKSLLKSCIPLYPLIKQIKELK